MTKYTKHLVVPDNHARPEQHNKRALYLGALIEDVKPDTVIFLGDSADMPSLCSYDKGTKGYEGRRYQKDIEAHSDFQDKCWGRVSRPTKDSIRKIILEGNHEYRITRAVQSEAWLDGKLSYDDLQMELWFDEVVRYNGSTPGVIDVDGIDYAHYCISGVMGRPIGGEHPAHSLLVKRHKSTTVGHAHTEDYTRKTVGDGRRIRGLVAGCFDEGFHSYAGEACKMWWSGVWVKTDVRNGDYDLVQISYDRLKREYGRLR